MAFTMAFRMAKFPSLVDRNGNVKAMRILPTSMCYEELFILIDALRRAHGGTGMVWNIIKTPMNIAPPLLGPA